MPKRIETQQHYLEFLASIPEIQSGEEGMFFFAECPIVLAKHVSAQLELFEQRYEFRVSGGELVGIVCRHLEMIGITSLQSDRDSKNSDQYFVLKLKRIPPLAS